jgi:hypothetical protein
MRFSSRGHAGLGSRLVLQISSPSESQPVSARQKLNNSYFNGALILAAIVGIVAQSWGIFLVVLGVLLVGSLCSGEIRLRPRGR